VTTPTWGTILQTRRKVHAACDLDFTVKSKGLLRPTLEKW